MPPQPQAPKYHLLQQFSKAAIRAGTRLLDDEGQKTVRSLYELYERAPQQVVEPLAAYLIGISDYAAAHPTPELLRATTAVRIAVDAWLMQAYDDVETAKQKIDFSSLVGESIVGEPALTLEGVVNAEIIAAREAIAELEEGLGGRTLLVELSRTVGTPNMTLGGLAKISSVRTNSGMPSVYSSNGQREWVPQGAGRFAAAMGAIAVLLAPGFAQRLLAPSDVATTVKSVRIQTDPAINLDVAAQLDQSKMTIAVAPLKRDKPSLEIKALRALSLGTDEVIEESNGPLVQEPYLDDTSTYAVTVDCDQANGEFVELEARGYNEGDWTSIAVLQIDGDGKPCSVSSARGYSLPKAPDLQIPPDVDRSLTFLPSSRRANLPLQVTGVGGIEADVQMSDLVPPKLIVKPLRSVFSKELTQFHLLDGAGRYVATERVVNTGDPEVALPVSINIPCVVNGPMSLVAGSDSGVQMVAASFELSKNGNRCDIRPIESIQNLHLPG